MAKPSRSASPAYYMGPLLLAVAVSSALHAPPVTPTTVIWRGASLAARRSDSSAATQAAVASL
eukprot:COSAG01_NODE_45036_length_413_cov_0.939490_1_plen_62_part_01